MEHNDENGSNNSSNEEENEDMNQPPDDTNVALGKDENDKEDIMIISKDGPQLMINTIKKFIGSEKLDMGVTCAFYSSLELQTEKMQEYLTKNSNHGLTGLKNLGNTSYFNSIVQCLSHCPDLVYYYLSGLYKNDVSSIPSSSLSSMTMKQKGAKHGDVSKAFASLLTKLWLEDNKSVSPTELKYAISDICSLYNSNLQQDSHEFGLKLLELIHDETNISDEKMGKNLPFVSCEPKDDNESYFDASKRFWDYFTQRNKSIISSLFYGQLKNEMKCLSCGYSNVTFETFLTLPIQIPKLRKVNVFLVPSTNIKSTIELSLFISENALFIDLDVYLKQYLNSGFERFKTLLFNACSNSVKFVKLSENIYNSSKKGQIFIYEISDCVYDGDNEDYFPFITLINTTGKMHISYPRILAVNAYVKVKSLRMRLYGFLRKYISLPNDIINQIGNDYNDLIENFTKGEKGIEINDTQIDGIIDREYTAIFGNETNAANHQEFLFSLKFKATLVSANPNSEPKLFFSNNYKEYTESFADNLSIDKVIEFTRNGYKLVIEMENDSYTNALNQMVHITSSSEEKIVTMDDALIDFALHEKMEKGNEWYCPRCKKNQNAYKRMEVFYLPKYFIIMIKRFVRNYLGKNKVQLLKVNDLLDFPINNLDMTKYCLGPKEPRPLFDLFAVSQHSGSNEGGRYNAACKNFGKWYMFDDSSYFKSDSDSIVSPEAYILFYKKIKGNK